MDPNPYFLCSLAGESMYRGIPGAVRVAEILKASSGCLIVQWPEGPFGFHGGHQQPFIKHQHVPGLALDGLPPACLSYEPHTNNFPHHKQTNVKTQEELQGVFLCIALRCGSLSPAYLTSQLENYSRLTCLRKCSNLHQFWKKALVSCLFLCGSVGRLASHTDRIKSF